MFRLFKFSAFTRRQAILLPLLMAILPFVGYAQTTFTFVTDPEVFEEGDTLEVSYSVSSPSAIDQVSFSHALEGWVLDPGCTPEVILDNSWFCANNSCEVTIDVSESRDSIHVQLARSSSSPISGNGEVLTLKGIEVLIDDLWVRKAGVQGTELFSLSISPNPCSDLLVIESRIGDKSRELVMRNIQGQIVWAQSVQAEISKISVAHLPVGLYWLQTVTDSFYGSQVPIRIIR